jgi:hypothetical protein
LRGILRFYNPQIRGYFFGFKLVEMGIKIGKLIWKNVSIWDYVKIFFAKLLLHLNYVIAKSILPCELKRLREMVNLLSLTQAFILIQLK